jgi:ABC-type sulfate/molybdate transport systems ATPase subunit
MADVAPGIVDGTFLGLADRIVVLKEGCVEQVGTPMELYKRPAICSSPSSSARRR